MTQLSLTNVSVNASDAKKPLLKKITVTFRPNELTVILGPNGAGKSTLLHAAMGQHAPSEGSIELDGADIAQLPPLAKAQKLAWLPQQRDLAWPLKVRDVVALGRFAYGGSLSKPAPADAKIIDDIITKCHLTALQDRACDHLSGGELARLHCARTFVTQAPLILADEPITALDPAHQASIMKLFRAHVSPQQGVVMVLHDLSLAAQFADRLIWLQAGEIVADGSVAETMTIEQIRSVFKVNAQIHAQNGQHNVTILHD